jgi:peptidoglycan/LPS O-acetylase OafA/YrhL
MRTNSGVMTANSEHNPHGDGRYIPILDGWRAVAILLVLAFHGIYNSNITGYKHLQLVSPLVGRVGAMGVLIFFAISGYLITQRLLVETVARGQFSIREFYIKRVFRILPPLAAYLFVIAVLFALGFLRLQARDLTAVVFLTNYIRGTWYTSHFWSLSVEEHFYLVWPVCAFLLGWRRAMWVGFGVIAAVAIWRPWALRQVSNPSDVAGVLQHTDMRIDYIMMGAVMALLIHFYPAVLPALKKMGSIYGLTALVLLLWLSTRNAPVDMRSVQAVILTLMVCVSALADAKLPRLLLSNRPILFLGKVSYSLYIWQQLFLAPTTLSGWNSPKMLPLKYLAAFVTAYISYRFMERPFIHYGRSIVTRQRAHRQAEATNT